MPFGDPQGNFAGTGGYGGQFAGFGGASAGYTGGYGNPSSVGQGTAGQTYAGQPYANTLNKYNPTLPNYSGTTNSVSGPSGSGGITLAPSKKKNVTAAQQAEIQARIKANKAASDAYDLAQAAGPFSSTNPVPSKPTPTQPAYQSAFPNGNFTAPTRQEWYQGNGGLGFGGAENWNSFNSPEYGDGGRQFGGPVAPGGQYTVGENGPETLQMTPGGGGQVIPNNPMDRMPGGLPGGAGQPSMGGGAGQLGGMNPQMMQALFQMIQQRKQGQPGGGLPTPGMPQPLGGGMQRPPTPPPQMPGPMGQGPGGGSFRLGDWRNRMGIEGLSRPPQSMGFGGSGLGIPGVMGQMRNRMG